MISVAFSRGAAHLQDGAVVEVVGAGPTLQRGEGHVPTGERRDVAEVVGAERLLLVLAGADETVVHLLVGLLTGAAVVLVRHPGAPLGGPLVDGEALWTAGVELKTDVGDVEGLTCRKQEVTLSSSSPWLCSKPPTTSIDQTGCKVFTVQHTT